MYLVAQQSPKLSHADSLILQAHLTQIKLGNSPERARLSALELDSIFQYEDGARLLSMRKTLSPDKKFSIYTLEIEECGQYCNSTWYNWVHRRIRKKDFVQPLNFNSIYQIHKLELHRYLILDESFERPSSSEFQNCYGASMLIVNADTTILEPIPKLDEPDFRFCQETDIEPDSAAFLIYNRSIQSLDYRYREKYYDDNDELKTRMRIGRMRYMSDYFETPSELILEQ